LEITIWSYFFCLLGAALAGMINTFAGNGSVITLSLLTEVLGLPGQMANGTNRIGVFFQGIGSATGFAKSGISMGKQSLQPIIVTILGAIAGVITVLEISNEDFLFVFKWAMVVMLVVVLIQPEKWISKENHLKTYNPWVSIPIFFIIGFYGGFLQMGAGILLLAVFVLLSGYNIITANALKNIVILVYTAIVLVLFAWNKQMNWGMGLILASGQTAGGYLSARYLTKVADIEKWSYRLLVIVILIALASQFGVF